MFNTILFSLVFPLIAFASINGKADYQFWQRTFFKKKMVNDWTLVLVEECRMGDNASKFYYTYLQANLSYAPVTWFSIAPGYRQIYKRSPLSSNHFRPEYNPLIDIYFQTPIGSWNFLNRNRIQYLIFGSNPSHWLYRNLVRFASPWKFTSFEARPYIEDEVFWRQSHGINENRTVIGVAETLAEYATIDLFYIARFLKNSSGWAYNNVFGFNLIFKY